MNKQTKLALGISIIIVIFFALYAGWRDYQIRKSILSEVPRNLTNEQRAIYETRLSNLDIKIGEAKDDNERYNFYMEKGFNLYGLGKLAESKDWYVKASELSPNDYTSFVALYQTQLDMNDNKGAKASIKKALTLKNDDPDVWKKYIDLEVYRFKLSNEKIKALFVEALNSTSTSASRVDVITHYAVYLEKIGELDGAIIQWQRAAELDAGLKTQFEAEISRLQTKLDYNVQ